MLVVTAYGVEIRIDEASQDAIGYALNPVDRRFGSDRHGDGELADAAFPGRQDCGFHASAGG